ncbi:hypothetical protein [Novosphingobium sp.]|uniref:hypothetical protein n=1 Tax=Novosphingobium sp. TaxID=1874826 RepID=UPI00286B8C8E|nr:hypothetical protein [Novosphingobium sp.]
MRATLGHLGLVAALVLTASAMPAQAEERLDRMMAGESWLQGKELDAAIATAEAHPLGSEANPVRVTAPQGQRAYLSRQRCSNGKAPTFFRRGNVGEGPFGNIVDLYIVTCDGAEPAESMVYMDMYHGGFMEKRPLPGFAGSPPPLPAPEKVPEAASNPRG